MHCDDIDDINTSNIIDSNIRAAYLNKVKDAIERTIRMQKIPEKNIDINSIINDQKCESIRGTVEKIKSALYLTCQEIRANITKLTISTEGERRCSTMVRAPAFQDSLLTAVPIAVQPFRVFRRQLSATTGLP